MQGANNRGCESNNSFENGEIGREKDMFERNTNPLHDDDWKNETDLSNT
jgi:hypothetical protein